MNTQINKKIIAFSGVARAGKDTFATLLGDKINNTFPNLQYNIYSFANGVRLELEDFIQQHYNVSPWTEDPKEKNLIRPLLIAHGNAKRYMSNNQYWIDFLSKALINDKSSDIAIISDLRFAGDENDEAAWVKKNNGLHIHIRRYEQKNGKRFFVKPNNEFEKENEPLLQKAADKVIEVDTYDNRAEAIIKIYDICQELINERFSFFHK